MGKFIQRNFERTLHDDFVLNVQIYMEKTDGAIPVFIEDSAEQVGWIIKPMYE